MAVPRSFSTLLVCMLLLWPYANGRVALRGTEEGESHAGGIEHIRSVFRSSAKPRKLMDVITSPSFTFRQGGDIVELFDFGFIMSFGMDSYCFDLSAWCRGIKATAMSKYAMNINNTAQNLGQTWLNTNALCYVAEEMLNQTSTVLVASGTFKITHDGKGGPATQVDLNADLDHVSMAVADASAAASTEAFAANEAYAYTSTDELCNLLGANGGWVQFLCTDVEAEAEVIGVADAQGTSSGYASARAGGYGTQEMSIVVEGEDIRKFSSVITATAGSFAFADAKATVSAVTNAFLTATANAFAESCLKYVDETCAMDCVTDFGAPGEEAMLDACLEMMCTAEMCDYAYATDELNTTAVGESLAHTLGVSFDESSFHFLTQATYQHSYFTSIEDQVYFGYEGKGFAGVDATITCDKHGLADL